jgi:hypothetical protein
MKLYGVCMALVAICALGSASARTKLPAWNPPQQQIAQPQAAPLATPGQQPQQEYQLQPVPETVQPAARASAPPERGAYRLGTGDKLKVTIYNNDKLSGEYPIGGDGKVALPMLGRVAVGGMTLDEVSNVLTNLPHRWVFRQPARNRRYRRLSSRLHIGRSAKAGRICLCREYDGLSSGRSGRRLHLSSEQKENAGKA